MVHGRVTDLSGTKPLRFSKIQDMLDHLYSDLDYYDGLKTRLISMQRANNGFPLKGGIEWAS